MGEFLTLEDMIQDYQRQQNNYKKQLQLLEKSFMNRVEREELCVELRNKVEKYDMILPLFEDLKNIQQGQASNLILHKIDVTQKYLELTTWFSAVFQREYFEIPEETLDQTNLLISEFQTNLKRRKELQIQTEQYEALDSEEYRFELANYNQICREKAEEEIQKEQYCQQYEALKQQCQGYSFIYKQFHRAECHEREEQMRKFYQLFLKRKGSIAILDHQLSMFTGTLAVQEELDLLNTMYQGTLEQEQLRLQEECEQLKQQLKENELMRRVNQVSNFCVLFVSESYCKFRKFHQNMKFLKNRKPNFYQQIKMMDPVNRHLFQKYYYIVRSQEQAEATRKQSIPTLVK